MIQKKHKEIALEIIAFAEKYSPATEDEKVALCPA